MLLRINVYLHLVLVRYRNSLAIKNRKRAGSATADSTNIAGTVGREHRSSELEQVTQPLSRIVRPFLNVILLLCGTACCEPGGIDQVCRVVAYVRVEVHSLAKTQRVFADESSRLRIVVPRSRKLQVGFRVEISSCVAERIRERTCRGGHIAERVERVRLSQCSGGVAQRCDRAEPIRFVVN